jgi:N-acetylglucosaminyldiphosphoundecaprenol N-acetyl-beta-D-mannosaminyltransferase
MLEAPICREEKIKLDMNLPRTNVLGVGVSAINMAEAIDLFEQFIENGNRGYVCVTGVHGVMEAQKDPVFGMPTVWVGRAQGFRTMDRVFGPDLMLGVCEMSVRKGYTHFLYGGQPGVAEKLRSTLESKFPGLRVVGTFTPPFGPLKPEQESELIDQVAATRPDFFWVGLSTPKQERWMAEYGNLLNTRIMIGVGAAFDLHTGGIQDAPEWVKQSGLQWLHRLKQEPRRLWKRYLINNPAFLWRIALQFLGVSRYVI